MLPFVHTAKLYSPKIYQITLRVMRTYRGVRMPKQAKASRHSPTTTESSLEPRIFRLEDSFIKITEVGNQLSFARVALLLAIF